MIRVCRERYQRPKSGCLHQSNGDFVSQVAEAACVDKKALCCAALHHGTNADEVTEEQLEEESIEEREFKLSVQARRKSPLDASSSYRSTGSSDDSSEPDNPGAASPSPPASSGMKADATLASLAHRQQASKRSEAAEVCRPCKTMTHHLLICCIKQQLKL